MSNNSSSPTSPMNNSFATPLSQFELEREARIAKNVQRMKEMGLENLIGKHSSMFPPVVTPTPRKVRERTSSYSSSSSSGFCSISSVFLFIFSFSDPFGTRRDGTNTRMRWTQILLPDTSRNFLTFQAGYDQRLFDGWVRQPSPCCGAASVAGAFNALQNIHRDHHKAKNFRYMNEMA